MANETHKITINGKVASIVLGDVYDNGAEYNIGSVLGIEKLGENESLPEGTFPIDIASGLKNGLLARLAIRHKSSAVGDKTKTSRIICPIDKAASTIGDLIGKTYNGRRVTSVSIPQRRRLS